MITSYDVYSPYVAGFYGGVGVFPGFGLNRVDYDYDYEPEITIINQTPPAEIVETVPATGVTSETSVIVESDSPVIIESERFDSQPNNNLPAADQLDGTAGAAEPVVEPLSGPPSQEDLAQVEPDLLEIGNAAFNQGDYRGAVRNYIAAIMTDEESGYPRLFYGLGQFALGDYGLAAIGVRRALSVSRDLITNPIDVRSIYPSESVFLEHMRKLHAHVADSPDDTEAKFLLGYLYFASASPENALSLFSSVLADTPGDPLVKELQNTATDIVSQGFQNPE